MFEVGFALSEEPQTISYRTVSDLMFSVIGGSVGGARRLVPGKNRQWVLKVAPHGTDDVTLRVNATTDCSGSLIIASALEAGCDTLLTEDLQTGRRIEGSTIVNPFA